MERIIWIGPYETREKAEIAAMDFVQEHKGEVVLSSCYIDDDIFYFSAVRSESLYDIDYIINTAFADSKLQLLNMSFSHVPSEQRKYIRAFNHFLRTIDDINKDFVN